MPFPADDLGLVALGGTLLRLLARKAQSAEQMPQMADAVLDTEAFGDHLADARQCPQLGRIPGRQSAGHEYLAQFPFLLRIELPWAPQLSSFERLFAAF